MVKEGIYRGHQYLGFFCLLEGGDGCGKTTQLKLLKADLEKSGYVLAQSSAENLKLREPGGTRVGEQVRNILLSKKTERMALTSEMLLYMAARAQLVDEVLKPALNEGKIVLLDRYLYSTLAYQGAGGGMPVKDILEVGKIATQGINPDLTLIFDIPIEVAMERINPRSESDKKANGRLPLDRIESRGAEYRKKVRQGYLDIVERDILRVKLVDGSRSVQEVYEKVKEIVFGYLHESGLENTLKRSG